MPRSTRRVLVLSSRPEKVAEIGHSLGYYGVEALQHVDAGLKDALESIEGHGYPTETFFQGSDRSFAVLTGGGVPSSSSGLSPDALSHRLKLQGLLQTSSKSGWNKAVVCETMVLYVDDGEASTAVSEGRPFNTDGAVLATLSDGEPVVAVSTMHVFDLLKEDAQHVSESVFVSDLIQHDLT